MGLIDRPSLDGDPTGGGLGGRIVAAWTPEWNKRASDGSLLMARIRACRPGRPVRQDRCPNSFERYSGAIGPVKTILVCAGAWTLSPR